MENVKIEQPRFDERLSLNLRENVCFLTGDIFEFYRSIKQRNLATCLCVPTLCLSSCFEFPMIPCEILFSCFESCCDQDRESNEFSNKL